MRRRGRRRCRFPRGRPGHPVSAELPGRALVVGMGLSGEAAAGALRERGAEVVTADREDGTDDELALLDGVDVLVKSPGVPAENPLVVEARSRGIPVWSEVELGYRLLPERPARRHHGHEGEDDDRAPARRDPGSRRPAGRAGRERAAAAQRGRRLCPAGHVARLRADELPARGRTHPRARRRRAAQPGAGPSRPPRHLRGVPRREAANLRTRGDLDRPGGQRPAGSRLERRRAAAGRAADPRRAQPRERRRRDASGARAGRPRGGDRRGARVVSRCRASARADRGDRRRPLGERLEGDDRRRRRARARRLCGRARAPDRGRARQGAELRGARGCVRAETCARPT